MSDSYSGERRLIALLLFVPHGGDSAAFFESAHSQRAAEASNPLLCGSRLTIRTKSFRPWAGELCH